MSDDLIARRMAQRQQQGCESESGVLTINRCYFEHGEGTARAARSRRCARLCSAAELEREAGSRLLQPSVSSDVTASRKEKLNPVSCLDRR